MRTLLQLSLVGLLACASTPPRPSTDETTARATPPWPTYQMSACRGILLDLPSPPRVSYVQQPRKFRDIEITAYRVELPPGYLLYKCRSYLSGIGGSIVEVLGVGASDKRSLQFLEADLADFAEGWTRGTDDGPPKDGIVVQTLTHVDGRKARLRVEADDRRAETFVAVNVPEEASRYFETSRRKSEIEDSRQVEVRSAECGSSVTMPGWPNSGWYNPSNIGLLREIDGVAKRLQCVEINPECTDAEVLDQGEKAILNGEKAGFEGEERAGNPQSALEALSRRDMTIDGRPGRETHFATSDGSFQIWMRIARDGDRLQAAVLQGTKAVVEAEGRAYLDTFRIVRPNVDLIKNP